MHSSRRWCPLDSAQQSGATSQYLDETAQLFDVISISAGMRGLQILLAPDDYIFAVGAKVLPIGKSKE